MNTGMSNHRVKTAIGASTKTITSNQKGASPMKSLLTLTAVLLFASSAAFAQFETDHFKCYLPTATSVIPLQPVLLQDQFGTATAKVGTIWRFCNPTVKNHNGVITPITNPDAHLAIHKAAGQPLVTREVQLENQFGVQTIITGRAKFPARARFQPRPLQLLRGHERQPCRRERRLE